MLARASHGSCTLVIVFIIYYKIQFMASGIDELASFHEFGSLPKLSAIYIDQSYFIYFCFCFSFSILLSHPYQPIMTKRKSNFKATHKLRNL